MYFEESVIDGVLCHRTSASDPYIPYTAEELTTKLQNTKKVLQEVYSVVNVHRGGNGRFSWA